MTPDRGLPRLARTLVFALVALGLSVAGHLLGGGAPPTPGLLALTAPPVLLISLWLSAQQRRLPALLGILTALQAALHVAYHLGHVPLSARVVGPGGRLAGSGPLGRLGHAGRPDPATLDQLPSPHLPSGHLLSGHLPSAHHGLTPAHDAFAGLAPSPLMLAGHVLAIVVTAWVLARGERALWRVVHRLRVCLAPAVPVIRLCRAPRADLTDLRALVSRWSGRVVATRGPPVPALG